MNVTVAKHYGIWAGLFLASIITASAVDVTFQVNMSAQIALASFDPANDQLFVAGDPINGWSTAASQLLPSASDTNIWEGTFDVPGASGSTVQYKYVKIPVAGGTVWEGNVGTGGATGNRVFTLAASPQTLPVVYFNNVTNSSVFVASLTFQVNMSLQTALGNFDPASGTVSVAGDAINNWSPTASPLTNSVTDTNLWLGTFKITNAAGINVSYKYVLNNGGTWEGNVGTGGAQNRSLVLSNQVLPVAYFNNLTNIPTSIPLTFQVNLAAQIARGNFDPAAGSVSVAGDVLNTWSPTASVLTNSVTDSNVWTGTFTVNSAAGSTILYKYVLNGGTWEGGDNRMYTLTSTNQQSLPLVFFNSVADLGPLSISPVSGGQITISWTAGPQIRLQRASSLSGPWQDVPNTAGQSSVSSPIQSEPAFFRLAGP
jgi:hypothetical protein